MATLKNGRSRVIEQNHIVILGFTDKERGVVVKTRAV